VANTNGDSWDEASPARTDQRRDGAQEILSLRKGTSQRANKEHATYAASGVGGEHKAGSAKAYYQANAPTLRPDGVTALDTNDKGRLWVKSTDNSLYQWDGSAWQNFELSRQSFDLPGSPGADETWTYGGTAFPLTTPFATPIQVSNLQAGRWMFWIAGTFDGSQTGSFTITINGQSRTIYSATTVDGQVPFLICIRASVTSSNLYARITAISGTLTVNRLESFSGVYLG